MACTSPIRGYRAIDGRVFFSRSNQELRHKITQLTEVPCGQCIACRLERSRQWAIRIMHEASLHEENSFLTLSYDEAHLPNVPSLNKRDWVLFAKRLRKNKGDFRYFHCGEYGDRTRRPHYHAIVFGHDFREDRQPWGSPNPEQLYVSEGLNWLWKKGNVWIGDVTFESAAYVARYTMKKAHGSKAHAEYTHINYETGEVHELTPEYATMSRRPGIGAKWIEKWKDDVYPSDQVVSRGRAMKPPKYYDQEVAKITPSTLERVKRRRQELAERKSKDETWQRQRTREELNKLKLARFAREPGERT